MARLPQGVRKRNNGLYEKRFSFDGMRYSVYAINVKELAEKEQELRQALKAGTYSKNRNITFDRYFSELIDRKKTEVKGNTIRNYKSVYERHLKPEFGECKLSDIERRQVIRYQQKHDTTPENINYSLLLLNLIFNEAVKDEIITRNPAKGVKPIKTDKKAVTETKHRALSEEEQKLFMQEAKTSYYYEFFAFMLSTGVRAGEAAAITWGDIDFNNSVIHINKTKTFDENNKLTIGTPKSGAGKRDIPLTETTKEILRTQRAKMGQIYNIDFKNDNIFLTVYGKIIRSEQTNHEIERIIKTINDKGYKMERFTSHAFRDTFATRFIEQGGQPQTLKTILGHSSLAMTMDLYAHVLPNTKAEEMNRITIAI